MKAREDKKIADKITLREAMEDLIWLTMWLDNPDRNIEVTMTYSDLYIIHKILEKEYVHKKDENGQTYMEERRRRAKKKDMDAF